MMHVLQKIGKEVTVIIGDSKPPTQLSFLPGFDQIQLKSWFDLDLSQHDLFISQDSSSLGQISKLGEIKFPDTMRVVVIDHHGTNVGYGHVNFVEPSYPAVCQMDYELCREWKLEITPDAAICFFVGIYNDTGGFKYQSTTSKTLKAAADLAVINPSFPKVIFELENNYEPEHLKFIGLSLSMIELYFGGRVAVSAVPYSELEKRGIKQRHTEKIEIANMLKSVKDWEIGIRFTEIGPDVISLSFRTRDVNRYDVGKIALATKFGGGHSVASGATLRMPFAQAKKYLLDTIKNVYPDLGEP